MTVIRKKRELRMAIRQQTAKLARSEMEAQARAVFSQIEKTRQFRNAKNIAMFWSVSDEIPTHDTAMRWSEGKKVYLPVTEGESMRFARYEPGCHMKEGILRMLEPTDGETISPAEIDLIIVPGYAFDTEGRRLGRGKGFYDRFLSQTKAFSVGVCLKHQMVEELPFEDHDKKVHMVVSPLGNDNVRNHKANIKANPLSVFLQITTKKIFKIK